MIIIDVKYKDTSNTAEIIDDYLLRRMIALLIEDLRTEENTLEIEADVNDAMDRLNYSHVGIIHECTVSLQYT